MDREQSAKEFDRYEEGLDAWAHYYARYTDCLPGRMQFIAAPNGERSFPAAFFDGKAGRRLAALGFPVRRDHQGSRPRAPADFPYAAPPQGRLGYREIYVSTDDPWVAARLHGVRLPPDRENLRESLFGWRILKTLTNHPRPRGARARLAVRNAGFAAR